MGEIDVPVMEVLIGEEEARTTVLTSEEKLQDSFLWISFFGIGGVQWNCGREAI